MAFVHEKFKLHSILVCFIFIIILFCPMIYSLSDGEALLKFKNSLSNVDALSSWDPNTSPCQGKINIWAGIMCIDGIVTGLRLKSMGLSGNIDVDALSSIPGIRMISLEDNKFSGPIPEFNRLGALKALYLTNNEFSGQIPPDYFTKMESLKKLWLSNNKFSGVIPSSLAQLKHLMELHLEDNQFTGAVPPFTQPPLVSLGLANNQLSGEIPKSLSNFQVSTFDGNPDVCGDVIKKDCSKASNKNEKKGSTKFVAVGITIGVVLISLVVIFTCIAKKKKIEPEIPTANKRTSNAPGSTKPGGKNNAINMAAMPIEEAPVLTRKGSSNHSSRRSTSSQGGSGKAGVGAGDLTMVNEEKGAFGMADLMRASAEVLGNGSMGSAYKAVMANGLSVAVKRMRELNKLEKEDFDAELRKLASLRHKNILAPVAYHFRKEEKLVVYEHVAKGSLHFILHGDKGLSRAELNWPTRLKIIKGITEGLQFLHAQLATYTLPHGNLKSSNILINQQNEPLLSDFGFCTLVNPNASPTGLFGYRSPEALQNQTVSPKSDIYCLGVVFLEILTGKFPSQYLNNTKGGTDVVQWVTSAMAEGREASLLEPNMVSTSASSKENMVELLHVGVACSQSNPDSRPGLNEVLERIKKVYAQDGDDSTIEVLLSPRAETGR